MRVLHVYSGNLYGGVESMLVTLQSRAAGFPGLEPEFALCFEGRLSRELVACGARVHFLGSGGGPEPGVRWSRPWTILRARARLRALLGGANAPGRFHAVICHSPWSWGIFGPEAARSGVPLIFWLHDALSGDGWIERLGTRLRPELLICNSAYTEASARPCFRGTPTQVLHCPVAPPAGFDAASARGRIRSELGIDASHVVLAQVSRLERWKGHGIFLDALSALREHPGWTALIAGGPQRPREQEYLAGLQAQAREQGLERRVRFLGQRKDVPELLAASDLLVQPNLSPEPFGVVFVEALYAGLPVVSVTGGGAQEIVTPETGILLEAPRAELLSAALARLIESAPLRARLGAAGPARAREISDPARQLERLRALVAGTREAHAESGELAQ